MKSVDVVIGLQWGDEGKGRIVYELSRDYSLVVRFQGGANAGHTVYVNGVKHILHLLPAGVLHRDTEVGIGAGCVIDLDVLRREVQDLNVYDKVIVDPRAAVVLPFHKMEDVGQERRNGIGSTKRGIAPAYRDVYQRFAVRIEDLLYPTKEFETRFEKFYNFNKLIAEDLGVKFPTFKEIKEWLFGFGDFLKTIRIEPLDIVIRDKILKRQPVLLEGAQGTLLDIFLGTYPFVTSSHTVLGGALISLGIPYYAIGKIYGVFKAYTTRVGKGPFPTEIKEEPFKSLIVKKGNEYGATTGRERRVGWLDLPLLKYAIWINGVTHLLLTKLDVLEGIEEIKVAISYDLGNGKYVDIAPAYTSFLTRVQPVYKKFEKFYNVRVKRREDFPDSVKDFLKTIEEHVGQRIEKISVSKEGGLV